MTKDEQKCVECSALTGVRSDADGCGCALYASPDETGICSCEIGYLQRIDGLGCVDATGLATNSEKQLPKNINK